MQVVKGVVLNCGNAAKEKIAFCFFLRKYFQNSFIGTQYYSLVVLKPEVLYVFSITLEEVLKTFHMIIFQLWCISWKELVNLKKKTWNAFV